MRFFYESCAEFMAILATLTALTSEQCARIKAYIADIKRGPR